MSLPAKLKLGILFLIALILAAAVCLAIAPFLISTDAIRLRLARDLSGMTGYNVQLREPPRIRIFPFQASMANIVLTDNSQPDTPLMEAKEIIVRMSLWDAISGRARFAETRLIEPRFILTEPLSAAALRAAFARSPGSFGSALRAAEDKMKDGKDGAHEPLLAQPFGRIIIENGALAYPVPQPPAPGAASPAAIGPHLPAAAAPVIWEDISNIQAELDWPPKSRGAELAASGLWHGAQTSLNISADDALMLLSGGKTRLRISFNSAKGGITFTGEAQAGAGWTARGRLEGRSPGLDQTLSWLQLRPPFGLALTSPFTWQSGLKANGAAAELGNIILTLGEDASGDSGRGALDIAYENGLPHISGSLAFEKLNLSLPAPALFAMPQGKGRSGDSPIVDMPIFNLLGLDLRISVGEARFNGVAAQDVAASIQMRKSGLIFDIGTMRIFDGPAQSSLRLASDDDRIVALESRLTATNANLAALSRAAAAFAPALPLLPDLRGRANISLNMQAALPAPASAAPAWPLPAPKPPLPARGKRKAPPLPAAPQTAAAVAEARPAAGYYAIFSRDIWPYARGQLNFAINNGRLANFNMADFLSRLQAGEVFALPAVPAAEAAADNAPAFSFSRAEGRIEWDKGALNPIKAAIAFDGHRLELSGAADTQSGALALAGILDPLPLDKNGQCPDIACLRQSLKSALRFSAQNTAASAPAPAPAPALAAGQPPAAAPAPAASGRVANSAPAGNAGSGQMQIEIMPQIEAAPPAAAAP